MTVSLKKFTLFLVTMGMSPFLEAYPIYSEPPYPTIHDSIVVYYDATQGNQGLKDYAGPIYAHTGVLTEESASTSEWKYVVTQWGENTPQTKLDYVAPNLWKLTIGYPREYYQIPEGVKVTHLAFVFRSSQLPNGGYLEGKDVQNKDIFLEVYEPGITARFVTPDITLTFNDPQREPLFKHQEDTVPIVGTSIQLFTETIRTELWINGDMIYSVYDDTLTYHLECETFSDPMITVQLVAADAHGVSDTAAFVIILNPGQKHQERPDGLRDGVTIDNEMGTVTFSIFAPYKEFIHVIGDFNDWMVLPDYELYRHEVSENAVWYWLTIPVESGKEYGFQYLIDGALRIADPYTTKILDPWNDHFIPSSLYPSLKPYPKGKTNEIVSTVSTEDATPFTWTDSLFVRPPSEKLVIYEVLLRDFLDDHSYLLLIDTLSYLKKLGVNAIELMPISEFEGNSSWGYNPIFYFAPDKYYGPAQDLKAFINACHKEGIAVIQDMVLNHAYGQSSMVRMYWNSSESRPSAENPWFNAVSPNPDYSWGFDFNHESPYTQTFVDSVLAYWIQEFHVDGYRLDFTKGFTNTPGNPGYDERRIYLINRLGNEMWHKYPDRYIILEHWADNREEQYLAQEGFMMWGNVTHDYQEASMGYASDFSWGYYKNREWSSPNLVTYMESHDEERIMYKNLTWGKSTDTYSIKDLGTALNRIKLISAFFYTIPGPKMIWQFEELGYDISIEVPCRICEKPILWDYYFDAQRKNLYKTTAALIHLRQTNSLFYSRNTQVDMDTGDMVKTITLRGSTMNSVVVGNFDVEPQNTSLTFPKIGVWYDYFSGDSLMLNSVSNLTQLLTLSPGEFHIYTDKKQPLPEEGILTHIT
ncbi:MAG: alpha-amylase family glycosyl hydrolase, partial [Candidatus Marinimicrobia bacterium]|nr:alpha-amylase family glycosyl hydrolase [Candidatus Neomarinimicrobiota bacterium]